MEEKRKVLFTDGMNNDFLLIITDAPKEAIEDYCRYHNLMMEECGHFEMFSTLKAKYYVKELLDSEVDEKEDAEIIGYDEVYDFSNYTKLTERKEGFRTVKLFAGMTPEFEIISTDAPDSVIKANMKYINTCEEDGEPIDNPYAVIEAMGYTVNSLGCQDDFEPEDMKKAVIDAGFDYYRV